MGMGWKAGLGLAISGVLLWWVFRDVEPVEVWREVQDGNLLLLGAAVAVATSGFLVRALRWRLLLHPLHPHTTLHSRFAAVNIGFMANNLLPARVGEFARAYSLSRLEPVSTSGAFGSLVVERILDGVAVLLLLTVALLSPAFPAAATVGGRPVVMVAWGFLAVLVVLLVFVGGLLFEPGRLLRWLERLAAWLPRRVGTVLLDAVATFLDGLRAFQSPSLLLGALAWSIGFWAWNGVSFWLALEAFGIEVGYTGALFVQAIIALGVAVPSAPGFFGTFHAAALVALSEVYGVADGPTLAFAFGYHLGGFIPVTLMGLWYAWRLGITVSDVQEAPQTAALEEDG